MGTIMGTHTQKALLLDSSKICMQNEIIEFCNIEAYRYPH